MLENSLFNCIYYVDNYVLLNKIVTNSETQIQNTNSAL